MNKRLREPACDAQAAEGNPQKLITSDFSEHSENYAVFRAWTLKFYLPIFKKPLNEKN